MNNEPMDQDNQPASELATITGDTRKNPLRDLRALNIDAAAQVLMTWTDKQRVQAKNAVLRLAGGTELPIPHRGLAEAPPSHQALYRTLVIAVVRALEEDDSKAGNNG